MVMVALLLSDNLGRYGKQRAKQGASGPIIKNGWVVACGRPLGWRNAVVGERVDGANNIVVVQAKRAPYGVVLRLSRRARFRAAKGMDLAR